MIQYIAYDDNDCETVRGECTEGTFAFLETVHPRIVQVSALPAGATFHDGENIVERPLPPSASHEWDGATKTWQPNAADAREKKRTAVAQEFARRTLWPVQYDGAPFDADEVARGRIIATLTRLIRGDGLPNGWIGWRDFTNAMHWTSGTAEQVKAQLAGLAAAIEDREQALLVAAWQHKAALDALTDIDDILAYDTAGNWPA